MSCSDQEEQRTVIIRSMFVNLQPLNSSQQETTDKAYSKAPPTPELTVEYIWLRNNDDAVTEPEALENYIKELRAESEAKKKQNRVDDDISTDELEEIDDATDILENRSCEEVRHRTASWEYSPIQRLSDSPRHPAILRKSPSKHQRITYSSQTHNSPIVSKSHSELQQMTDSVQTLAMRPKLSKSPVKLEPVYDSTSEQQTNQRRSSRISKKVEFRSSRVNLSITHRRLTSRQSRQKKVSRRPSPKFRRAVNTRTIGTQTEDYWFNMLMNFSCEYDIIPRQQAQ
ncbi:unnamed protein product [Pieris brassicae]|uniref:Uncharacterized protein n=1 Tax=Pieris brassicae TaxID=7116 RepID=A0A9P0SF64_PIEBR|nr:unnamed protein product [Pieris brassicae]